MRLSLHRVKDIIGLRSDIEGFIAKAIRTNEMKTIVVSSCSLKKSIAWKLLRITGTDSKRYHYLLFILMRR